MTFRFGNLTLDTESRALTRDGRPIAISPKAFKLLQILLEERPRAIPKAELHRRLWPDTVVSEVNLPTLIAEIRQAIGDGARAPEFIRTVYGYGYAFCGSAVAMSRDGRLAVVSDQVFRLLWGQREVALSEGENILGRGTDSLVWIDAQSVSRRHACASWSPRASRRSRTWARRTARSSTASDSARRSRCATGTSSASETCR